MTKRKQDFRAYGKTDKNKSISPPTHNSVGGIKESAESCNVPDKQKPQPKL